MSVEGLLQAFGSINSDLPESLTYSVWIAVALSLIVRIFVRTVVELNSPAFINTMRAFFHWLGHQFRSATQSPINRPRLRLANYLLSFSFSYLMSAFMLLYGVIFIVLLALKGPDLPPMNLLMLVSVISFFIYGWWVFLVQGDHEWLRFKNQLVLVRRS
ncbi:hypothetical protein [Marinomonas sp. FW-1]|uniref:hypothetical protein n=1 Tax=Marinomonas sp. FW-1 TaxID=2071621 RepID=UPI0010BFEC90|nr:hypothetical protein [Marinomonas sp. FW-1]